MWSEAVLDRVRNAAGGGGIRCRRRLYIGFDEYDETNT